MSALACVIVGIFLWLCVLALALGLCAVAARGDRQTVRDDLSRPSR